MKYYAIYDSNNEIYAYTPDLRAARRQARLIKGYYREFVEDEI